MMERKDFGRWSSTDKRKKKRLWGETSISERWRARTLKGRGGKRNIDVSLGEIGQCGYMEEEKGKSKKERSNWQNQL